MSPLIKFATTLIASAVIGQLSTCGGCGDTTPSPAPTATFLTVAITDAPSDLYEAAVLDIGAITLRPEGGTAFQIVADAGEYDLLQLQNGITADLAGLEIPPGAYNRLEMEVQLAEVTLAAGYSFRDGTTVRELNVPSGEIKVNLSGADGGGAVFAPGETLLVVDVDVNQNFVPRGFHESDGTMQGVNFTPLLRAAVADIAGSIAGAVLDEAGAPVEGVTIKAELVTSANLETTQTSEVTAITDASGVYTLHFLTPGEYLVSIPELGITQTSVTVGDTEAVSGVDFDVVIAAP